MNKIHYLLLALLLGFYTPYSAQIHSIDFIGSVHYTDVAAFLVDDDIGKVVDYERGGNVGIGVDIGFLKMDGTTFYAGLRYSRLHYHPILGEDARFPSQVDENGIFDPAITPPDFEFWPVKFDAIALNLEFAQNISQKWININLRAAVMPYYITSYLNNTGIIPPNNDPSNTFQNFNLEQKIDFLIGASIELEKSITENLSFCFTPFSRFDLFDSQKEIKFLPGENKMQYGLEFKVRFNFNYDDIKDSETD